MLSFSIPLSGLSADSDALALVSNNLANMNTTAYKSTTTQFRDLLYQNLGSGAAGNPIELGLGSAVASDYANFNQGDTNSTGIDTDMLIQGNGFFVLRDSSGNSLYTRNGSFSYGAGGALLGADGSNVMGWQTLNTDGTVNTSGALAPITVDLGQAMSAKATTSVQIPINLDATTSISPLDVSGSLDPTTATGGTVTCTANLTDSTGTQHALTFTFTNNGNNSWSYTATIPQGDVTGATADVTVASGSLNFDSNGNLTSTGSTAAITLPTGDTLASGGTLTGMDINLASLTQATGTPAAAQSTTPSYSTTALVYDSLGGTHTVSLNFTKLSTNAWQYTATIPGADAAGGNGGQAVQLAAGNMTFNPTTGLLQTVTQTTGDATTQVSDGNISVASSLPLADGAGALSFNWSLDGSNNTPVVTQDAATSSAGDAIVDGYASGTLESINVESDGTIQGVFSNGKDVTIGQLALAAFSNQEGLQQVGTGDYAATSNSGNANVGIAGVAGRGTVQNDALEASNVDIATEFSNLILAQRAYEANARTVTTFDQVYQDTINLKQS
jgi:flagellar hook protein FlgE